MKAMDALLGRDLEIAGDFLLFYARLQPSEFDALPVDRALYLREQYLKIAKPK